MATSDQKYWRLYQFDFMGLRNTTDMLTTTAGREKKKQKTGRAERSGGQRSNGGPRLNSRASANAAHERLARTAACHHAPTR